MDTLTIIISSVNYSDYLSLTLPEAIRYGRVIVATSPKDRDTISVTEELGAECFQTNAWAKDRAPFNKGAGINAALAYAKPSGWLLLLDSDIVLTPPPPDSWPLNKLDTSCLYGARRRDCQTAHIWARCLRTRGWFRLPLNPLPPVRQRGGKRKVWGWRPTANPTGLEGYFQLWHYPSFPYTMSEHRTAAKYDIELALRWPDDKRMLLPWEHYAVIHLGHARRNWKGRITARWEAQPVPSSEFDEAAAEHYG